MDILFHTFKRFPFMIPRVVSIVSRQYGYAVRPKLRESVSRQIEMEKAGDVTLMIDDCESVIPEGFSEFYKSVFPEVYQTVYERLKNKSYTGETLIEIYTTFLTESVTFEHGRFDSNKRRVLEIAGQLTEEKNISAGESCNAQFDEPGLSFDSVKSHVSDQMLKAVEQELLVENRGLLKLSSQAYFYTADTPMDIGARATVL